MACWLDVDRAAVIDIVKSRAGRVAGYQLDVDRQPTRNERFFHAAVRLIVLRNPLFHKLLTPIDSVLIDNSSLLFTTTAIYKE